MGIAVGTEAHLAISGSRRKLRHICHPVVIDGAFLLFFSYGGGGKRRR